MLAGRRVLLVEDEPLISMMLEDMLAEAGYVVAGSERDSGGAMAVIESAELDAAVLDIHIADGDSFHLADVLLRRGVPVVFSTGVGESEIPAPYRRHPFVIKPFDLPELEAALDRALPRPAAQ